MPSTSYSSRLPAQPVSRLPAAASLAADAAKTKGLPSRGATAFRPKRRRRFAHEGRN